MSEYLKTKYLTETDDSVVCQVEVSNLKEDIEMVSTAYTFLSGEVFEFTERFYKGVARRKEGDIPDIAFAKEVARKKALKATYKALKNYCFELYDKMRAIIDLKLFDAAIDYGRKAERIDNEIQEIMGLSTEEFAEISADEE